MPEFIYYCLVLWKTANESSYLRLIHDPAFNIHDRFQLNEPTVKSKNTMNKLNTKIPNHVALIMDGNGRWATQKNKPRNEGHLAGTNHLRTVIETFFKFGISHLSFYGFSTENWNRPKSEIAGIFSLLTKSIDSELQHIIDMKLKFVHIGRKERLPAKVKKSLIDMELSTESKDVNGIVSLAFNYGSRQEILDATKQIILHNLKPIEIDKNVITDHLYTAGIPDVDLLIRTGGEKRISNFLLWQSVNAKFISTDILWPDFTEKHVEGFLKSYSQI